MGVEGKLYSLTLTLDGSEWTTPRPGRVLWDKEPVAIVQEVGWVSQPVWTGAEYLAPTGIRSPDHPASC